MTALWNGLALITFFTFGFGSLLLNEAQAESTKANNPREFVEACH